MTEFSDLWRGQGEGEREMNKINDHVIEALPDLTPMLKPSTAGDFAAYFFFSAGGLFIGGETGLLLGGYSAKRTITGDPERKARVESAFRKFRADVLKREIAQLEKEDNNGGTLEKWF